MKELNCLANGAFYYFLRSQCMISFNHNPWVFDWISVQVRMQLIKLLDTWKAAQMWLTWLQNNQTDSSPDDNFIDLASKEEAEHRQLFEFALKKAYQEAKMLSDKNGLHDINEAPMPDLEFWRMVCNREIYEARLAAGEPVVFYKGRCCLYGTLAEYRDAVVPGPYPGLQYYHFFDNAYSSDERELWYMAQKHRNSDERLQVEPIPMGYGAIPCHVKRQRLLKECGIVGPATYAEFVNQHGLMHTINLAEEHSAYHEARRAFDDYTYAHLGNLAGI